MEHLKGLGRLQSGTVNDNTDGQEAYPLTLRMRGYNGYPGL